jgi:beta-N-acetylhexosaminidase
MSVLTVLSLIICSLWCAERIETDVELDIMVGQMLMIGFRGMEVNEESLIVQQIKEFHLGGIILFDYDVELGIAERNIENRSQLAELTSQLQSFSLIPLFIAVDQEGGRVARLKERHGFPNFYSAGELGRRNDLSLTHETAAKIAETLQKVNINLNLAPVVDLNTNPENPAIGRLERSFSSRPDSVAFQAEAFIDGLQAGGVLSCIKHFPGHGSAFNDSHYGLTDITNTWSEAELFPYEYLSEKENVRMIMTGHLFHSGFDEEHPATLSHNILNGILREELGFDGVIISDDMNMQAITDYYGMEEAVLLALQAGVDIILFANNMQYDPLISEKLHNYIINLVKDGIISRERISESYERIMRVKEMLEY